MSAAMPHWMPPLAPPLLIVFLQTTLPLLSGSSPYTSPDFWPTRRMSLPFGKERRIVAEAMSTSRSGLAGQLGFPGRPQLAFHASSVNCFDHFSAPEVISNARTASDVGVGGSE